MADNEKEKKNKKTGREKQLGPFKKTRGNKELTRSEIKQIKKERKELRRRLKKAGIRSRKDFETTASSMGLYFDSKNIFVKWWTLLGAKALWGLIGAALVLLAVMFLFSLVEQMRGRFTINLSEDMMNKGFRLSETIDFDTPSTVLYCEPQTNVPATTISKIPKDVMDGEGLYDNHAFVAYSFFMKFEGEETGFYNYELKINSEGLDASKAAWVMLFDQDQMAFFAHLGEDGQPEAVPAQDDNSRGFVEAFFKDYAIYPDEQYEVIAQREDRTYYRVIPLPFESDSVVTRGASIRIEPEEAHKFTVVMWLEGEDPECTNDIIGGHVGLEMDFALVDREEDAITPPDSGLFATLLYEWKRFLRNLYRLFDGMDMKGFDF